LVPLPLERRRPGRKRYKKTETLPLGLYLPEPKGPKFPQGKNHLKKETASKPLFPQLGSPLNINKSHRKEISQLLNLNTHIVSLPTIGDLGGKRS